LLASIFSNGELEGRSERIESIANSDPVGREVAAASRQMIEALMMAQSTSATPF
jgi:hypothetical protein